MKKSNTPSITSVRELLKSLTWNPRKPGAMKLVSEVESVEYLETQAKILISQAGEIRKNDKPDFERYQDLMTQAIRLLLLAKLRAE